MRMFKNGNKNAQKLFVPEENMLRRDITQILTSGAQLSNQAPTQDTT